MKVCVTGANGYIGSHVVTELLDGGNSVIAIDLNNANIDKRAIFVNTDIYAMSNDFWNKNDVPDVLLHFACKDVAVHNSEYHILSIQKNFDFIKNMYENGIHHIVTVGSMHDIGYYVGKVAENVETNPTTYYGIAKNTLRQLLEVYFNDKNAVYQHLRFFYTYGDDEQSSGSVFKKILQLEKEGKDSFPFTDGKNMFDYTEIHQLAKYVVAVISQKDVDGIVNVCSGKPIAIKDMVAKYIEKNNLSIKPDYGKFPSRAYDSPCIYGDRTKLDLIMARKK